MKRRTFLKMGGAAMMAAASSQVVGQNATPRNVVLFVADDWGMDDAGCYGRGGIHTPAVDGLAAEGVRFSHAFCTAPSCSASRSVILSGQYNHANGQYGLAHGYHHFASYNTVRSLPALMTEAGYRTICAGKHHVMPESAYHFEEMLPGKIPVKMAEDCKAVFSSSDSRPFFLYFCPSEPHRPFARKGVTPADPADVTVPPFLPDIPECRAELADYYGAVRQLDAGLERLMALLKETGHWEDTLVIVISDNGIPFPGAKTTLYDPGIHLPCIVRCPGQTRKGIVNPAMITWADLTPTILDYAGIAYKPDQFHGRSFLPVLDQENPSGWDEIYASQTFHEVTMYYPMRVVRNRAFKLIWNIAHPLEFPFASDLWESATWQAVLKQGITQYGARSVQAYLHRPRFELYDLTKDPGETVNVAEEPAYAATLHELQEKLKEFQRRTKDPWILKWNRE